MREVRSVRYVAWTTRRQDTNTQRIYRRAPGNHGIRTTVSILGIAAFVLLTGCADCISGSAPEIIPYCLDPTVDAAGAPAAEPNRGCIAQP